MNNDEDFVPYHDLPVEEGTEIHKLLVRALIVLARQHGNALRFPLRELLGVGKFTLSVDVQADDLILTVRGSDKIETPERIIVPGQH